MNIFSDCRKVLVIGAGSGADFLSASLIVEKLIDKGIEIDLAGFLTPWAIHYFDDKLEKPINELPSEKAKKMKLSQTTKDLPFYEPLLHKIIREENINIKHTYLFSLRYGTKQLEREIRLLCDSKKYDTIIVVDVGGDILSNKSYLKYIFTPIVDLSCLNIIGRVPINAKKYLAVISPGIDGELNEKQIKHILHKHTKTKSLISTEKFHRRHSQLFLRLLDKLQKRMTFNSHTPQILKRALFNKLKRTEVYSKNLNIDSLNIKINYDVMLDNTLSNSILYFDLKKVFDLRPIDVNYDCLVQAFKLFKKNGVGGTEIDLCYLMKQNNVKDLFFIENVLYKANNIQKKEIQQYIKDNIVGKVEIIK